VPSVSAVGLSAARDALRWLIVGAAIAVIAGTGSAALLATLDWVTRTRNALPQMIWLMPAAGAVTAWAYGRYGGRAMLGNGAIFAEVANPSARLPIRMATLVFAGTAIAHLTGASVGREGTAVQMAVPLSDALTRWGRWTDGDRRIVLSAAISGGFASVFGTPIAGMIFGLEVRRVGAIRYDALLACLVAAIGGNAVTAAWGIQHATYVVGTVPRMDIVGGLGAAVSGVAFGLAAWAFVRLTHGVSRVSSARVPHAPWRAALGGFVVVGAVSALGTDRQLGLSLPLIHEAIDGNVLPWDFAAKLFLTVVCVATGFRGGEVTPLFVVGATLGNALASWISLPAPLLAAMGLVATFAGASNAPLASIVAGIELFGDASAPFLAIACVVAYLSSGHVGMYPGQMIGQRKHMRF
jgi:H+/Cl- antiporter ClcA